MRSRSHVRIAPFVAMFVMAGCGASEPAPSETREHSVTTFASAGGDDMCGRSTGDWCPAPASDPCGAHRDTSSCRADQRCAGIPYRGESLVACDLDARCFASNCPTVGCVSRCEARPEERCEIDGYSCRWNGASCERTEPCHT